MKNTSILKKLEDEVSKRKCPYCKGPIMINYNGRVRCANPECSTVNKKVSMCSSIERHAATIWTLTDALCEGSQEVEVVGGLRNSIEKLRQFVCQDWNNDRAMNRLRGKLVDYINAKINPSGTIGINISRRNILAYCHMLSALANDFFDQLPERPIDRGIAWRNLTAEIACLINLLDKPGSSSQAAKGCKWANDIMVILRGI